MEINLDKQIDLIDKKFGTPDAVAATGMIMKQ
jgi:hypothetical protein